LTNIRTIKYLTQIELKRLLKAIDSPKNNSIYRKRDRAIFTLAYYHGLRASELGLIKLSDIDFSKARIRINRLKNSLGGEYPIQLEEIKALKAWLKQGKNATQYLFPSQRKTPISRRQIGYLMEKYGRIAGIPKSKRHFHVLKHSIATHLLEAGADIRFVQDWIGHKSILNTVIYAQITNRLRDEQALKLFANPLIVKL